MATAAIVTANTAVIPVEELLHLRRLAEPEAPASSRSSLVDGTRWKILALAVSGDSGEDAVRLTFVFNVFIHSEGWSVVPLLPQSIAIQSSSAIDSSDNATSGYVTIADGFHQFVCHKVGKHTVAIEALCAYTSKSKAGFQLHGLPACSQFTLSFTVRNRPSIQISVDPCLRSVNDHGSASDSKIMAWLAPTRYVNVRWTERQAAPQSIDPVQKLPLSATVDLLQLYTVGDGMLTISSTLTYDIRNGTIALFEVEVDARLRVLSVDGGNIKRWDIVRQPPADHGGEKASKLSKQLLKVSLDHGVDGSFELVVTSEMELSGASCDFLCPIFAHRSDLLTREKGLIAFEARANVEIEQTDQAQGVVPVDIDELPNRLRDQATNPILLAYKYLFPQYQLGLSVKKHGDVDVLIAAVDDAYFQATQVEEGKTMYRLVMVVRNTQKQYVRIDIPPQCEIWSTIVAGQGVKPARDESTGSIMVALEKSGGAGGNAGHASFTVELVWVSPAPKSATGQSVPLGNRGTARFYFPKVDLPLNMVFVSIFLPDDFQYGDFEGDLKECEYFSRPPPAGGEERAPAAASSHAAPQAQFSNMMRRASISSLHDAEPMRYVSKLGGKAKAGVVPVRVDMVTQRLEYHFERLLVVQQPMNLSVSYRKKEKSYFEKRHVNNRFLCC